MRSRHAEKALVSLRRLRIQPSSPPPNHPNNHLFRQPNSSPPPVSSSVLQPHGKHRQFPEPSARLGAGHLAEAYGPRAAPGKTARVGAGGCGPSALQPLRFADDVKDSPSGSKGWCYRELARICQLECVDTFLVMRSLLIAPGGGEAGLIFLALCKSLSAPLCFPFCARASSPDFCPLVQRYRSEEQLSPRHLQTCGALSMPQRAAAPLSRASLQVLSLCSSQVQPPSPSSKGCRPTTQSSRSLVTVPPPQPWG